MERLNLNIPSEARGRLRRLASARGRREAELARELLLEALERARREEFFRGMEETQTPEVTARELEIAQAMERLGG